MHTKFKILVVDDIIENIQLLVNLFIKQGYNVLPATNGKQALALAFAKKPDLILLDVQMPEMDGFEVCMQLKANEVTKDIPIIFITARSAPEDIIHGLSFGAVDYITKPINTEEVSIKVKNHLELKRSHDVINLQNEKLAELNATKDKFFSIIAHDLKSPISNFIGVTKVLVDHFDDLTGDETVEFLTLLNDSASRLYSLLENLLEWSRCQRGTIPFNPMFYNVTKVIEEVAGSLSISLEKKKIELAISADPELEAMFDSNMLKTILRNFISNAIKFSNPGGMIRVEVLLDKTGVCFEVVDFGVGMDKRILNSLFKLDSIKSTPGTANETGTGLGLTLCKEFVEKHGGQITVESEVGYGSKFMFNLPFMNV